MKLRSSLLVLAVGLASSSCSDRTAGHGCNADGNALDAQLCPTFEAASYVPVPANDTEMCTRLSVDLLGIRPTREWITDHCAGRKVYDVVVALQHTRQYRETMRRRWADRFRYNDYYVDIKSIHDLDALVDRLYEEGLTYPEFTEQVLAHPGFVGRFIGYGQPDAVADAAFRAFLGRPANTPERFDVGNLWRPWMSNNVVVEAPGGEGVTSSAAGSATQVPPCANDANSCGYYGYGMTPMIDPTACDADLHSCVSTLLGPATLAFPTNGRVNPLSPDQLTPADLVALQTPGRLFAQQPMLWEAEVDEVSKRYLGYDLGARRPEARAALVRWFQETNGDVVRLERAVLTSWAYRQSAVDVPDHPRPSELRYEPIAWGPSKLMIPETWLFSVAQLTGNPAGDCDWRYPNLPDWYTPGTDPKMDDLLSDVHFPKLSTGGFDPTFRDAALSMGGCPGTMDSGSFLPTTRQTTMGLLTAVSQEELVVKSCYLDTAPNLLPPGVSPNATGNAVAAKVVNHSLESAFGFVDEPLGRRQTQLDVERDCPGCTADTMSRDLCAAFSGGIEYIFY